MASADIPLKITRFHIRALRRLTTSIADALQTYEEEAYGASERVSGMKATVQEVTLEQAKQTGWPIEEVRADGVTEPEAETQDPEGP